MNAWWPVDQVFRAFALIQWLVMDMLLRYRWTAQTSDTLFLLAMSARAVVYAYNDLPDQVKMRPRLLVSALMLMVLTVKLGGL